MIRVIHRELRRIGRKPRHLIVLTLGAVFSFVFFATLTREGQPQELPVAVVDRDGTYLSRRLCHEIDATQAVAVKAVYTNHQQARQAMQRGEIYAFYEIPAGTYNEVLQFQSPHLVLYTNQAYLLAGSLSYRQLATMGKLAGGAVQREVLRKKGVDEKNIMGQIQPIALETHAVGNAKANYQVYLMTTLIPGILALMAMLHTAYAIGRERQERTVRSWMRKANGNTLKAFLGKMAPYTFHYTLLLLAAELVMYGPMHFPMAGSWPLLMLLSLLLVVAAQCAGCFLMGCIPDPSVGMSLTSAYGTLAFSMCGFSFPVEAMPVPMQVFSEMFPLRYFFLAMRDVTLFGNGLEVCWPQVCALVAFGLLLLIGVARWQKTAAEGKEPAETRVAPPVVHYPRPATRNKILSNLQDIWNVMAAEVRRVFSDKTTVVIFFLATAVYPFLYYYIYHREVMQEMPVAVVDLSGSDSSRRFAHKLDATPELRVAYRPTSLAEGEDLLASHMVKAVFLLPRDYGTCLAQGRTAHVTCYSDISSFLYYKNALLGGSNVMLDEMHAIELEHRSAEGLNEEQAERDVQPVAYDDVKLFNPTGGYASYFIPALLLLVVHQTLFFGICVLCGDANENRRALRLIPPQLRGRSIYRVTIGRMLCFLLIYIPITLFDLWVVPRIFGLPQLGSVADIILFLLPFVLATTCFAMTFGNLFSRERMSTLLCFLFFSVILFFMSGLVWPQSNMPRLWLAVSYLFPSTPGIEGYVRISSMGATLSEVRGEYMALWVGVALWFTAACGSLRMIKKLRR